MVLRDMTLFRFTNVNMEMLERAIETADLELAKEVCWADSIYHDWMEPHIRRLQLYQSIDVERIQLNAESKQIEVVRDLVPWVDARRGNEKIVIGGKGKG